MLNHCLEWNKWVLTNFDHGRQWFKTLIPPSHESASVYCVRRTFRNCDFTVVWTREIISTVTVRYTTPDIYWGDRRYECNGGIEFFSSSNGTDMLTRDITFKQTFCHKITHLLWKVPTSTLFWLYFRDEPVLKILMRLTGPMEIPQKWDLLH